MSRSKRERKTAEKSAVDTAAHAPNPKATQNPNTPDANSHRLQNLKSWPVWLKLIASFLISYHLLAMLASPWAIPPTSTLATSAQETVRHYQTAMFLNHGYRFFAPNPGPATVIIYRLKMPDGTRTEGIFPDRNAINRDYPRLLYHRWFMLSESIGNVLGDQVSKDEFLSYQSEQQNRQAALQQAGEVQQANALGEEIQRDQQLWDEAVKDRRNLLAPVARVLLKEHQAESIQLFLNRRIIPSPEQIRRGAKTRDPQFLPDSTLIELGQWTAEEFKNSAAGRNDSDTPTEATEDLPLPLSQRSFTNGASTSLPSLEQETNEANEGGDA